MAKGTKLSKFEKGEFTALKIIGKFQREFRRPYDAVKLLAAIT